MGETGKRREKRRGQARTRKKKEKFSHRLSQTNAEVKGKGKMIVDWRLKINE